MCCLKKKRRKKPCQCSTSQEAGVYRVEQSVIFWRFNKVKKKKTLQCIVTTHHMAPTQCTPVFTCYTDHNAWCERTFSVVAERFTTINIFTDMIALNKSTLQLKQRKNAGWSIDVPILLTFNSLQYILLCI